MRMISVGMVAVGRIALWRPLAVGGIRMRGGHWRHLLAARHTCAGRIALGMGRGATGGREAPSLLLLCLLLLLLLCLLRLLLLLPLLLMKSLPSLLLGRLGLSGHSPLISCLPCL